MIPSVEPSLSDLIYFKVSFGSLTLGLLGTDKLYQLE